MRKALHNAAGWLLPVLVALVATPWLIRAIGAPRYGVWTLCVMFASLLPTLDLGYGVASVRELASARHDAARLHQITGELFTLALLIGLAAWVAISLGTDEILSALNFEQAIPVGEAQSLMHLVGPWVALGFLNGALTALPRAHERFGVLAMLSTASSLGLWIGAIALAAAGCNLPQMLLFGVALQLVVCLALVATHRHISGRWPSPVIQFTVLPKMSRFALASFVGALTSLATYHADKALVSAFIGPAAAGIYTAAANVANKLLGLVASLAGVIYPRVSTMHAGGNSEQVAHLYLASSRMLMTLSIALGAIGVALAEKFLLLWLGTSVTPGLVLAFRLLIIAYVMASASVVASNVLSGQGNASRGAWFAALGGAITVLAGVVLIPRFGLPGAGWAGVLGMSQALAFDYWMERDLRTEHPTLIGSARRPWFGWLVSAGSAGLVAWTAAGLLPGWIGIFASGLLAVTASAALWFACGFASAEERQIAARLVGLVTREGDDRKDS